MQVLLSAPWYLNYISYGIDWPHYYQIDPQDFSGSNTQQRLVMGGEVCYLHSVKITTFFVTLKNLKNDPSILFEKWGKERMVLFLVYSHIVCYV